MYRRALLLAVSPLLATAPWLASASIAAPAMPAATAMPAPTYVPFNAPKPATIQELNQAAGSQSSSVQTFDTAGRAKVLARELPRFWSGNYQAFASGTALPVQLKLTRAQAIGQVVELRGDISIEGVRSPVQGTISAESDQLDLLVLGSQLGGGLQPGGSFQGLQGLELSGWNANRLTEMGGRLSLTPVSGGAGAATPKTGRPQPVQGLW